MGLGVGPDLTTPSSFPSQNRELDTSPTEPLVFILINDMALGTDLSQPRNIPIFPILS